MSGLRSNAEPRTALRSSQDDGGALLALGGGRRLRLDQREDARQAGLRVPEHARRPTRHAAPIRRTGTIAGRLAFHFAAAADARLRRAGRPRLICGRLVLR